MLSGSSSFEWNGTQLLVAKLGATHASYSDNGTGTVLIGDTDNSFSGVGVVINGASTSVPFSVGYISGGTSPQYNFQINANGQIVTYAGAAVTAFPIQVANVYQSTGQTGTTSPIIFTPATSTEQTVLYRLLGQVYISAITGGDSLVATVAYKSRFTPGTLQTFVIPLTDLNGNVLTSLTATGIFSMISVPISQTASNSITVTLTVSGSGTISYKYWLSLELL